MNQRLRTSIVLIHNDHILTFLAIDPYDGREFYFVPGGKIEPGETAPDAAVRETLEETGYSVEVDPASVLDFEYEFFWNRENYDCLTLFYRAHLIDPEEMPAEVNDTSYNKGVAWIPINQIDEVFHYNKTIRDAVRALSLE